MRALKGTEVRAAFLEFFAERGHTVHPSDSLIPTADPSLLFTGAGMNQFKDEFLGRGKLPFKRAATSQKCVRTGDIENVGRTPTHHTFFEMLGNFSFGDYFKEEAIEWAWKWVTEVAGLPKKRLAVSVYEDDNEAYEIWRKRVKVPAKRIHRFGEHDNFWPAGAPSQAPEGTLCGPCSEIFYDWGESYEDMPCDADPCDPSCSCGRFVEIWNLVFQQFEKGDAPGRLSPLETKNIDTGAGLERIAAVLQRKHSNYHTDLFVPLIRQVEGVAPKMGYGKSRKADVCFRRIADHARAVTFAIADGVLPSNEGRGYVVRRLLRRAVLDGRQLGIKGAFLYSMVPTVASIMGDQYPDLTERRDQIAGFVKGEEERFAETLSAGLAQLDKFAGHLSKGATLDGRSVFTLYDTYGFPVELTKEMLAERGIGIDREAFEREMASARERSRGGTTDDIFGYAFLQEVKERTTATEFVGYGKTEAEATVVAVIRGEKETGEVVDEITAQDSVHPGVAQIVLDRTPFYGEAGGQVGDGGELLVGDGAVFIVEDTSRAGDIFLHRGKALQTIRTGTKVRAVVDRSRRLDIARNHTATHILHHELRKLLGTHVEQAGSLVEPERLRLDFSHGQALTREETDSVERAVNERILADDPVAHAETTVEEAKAAGAMALFGEKYGERVRMVTVGEGDRAYSRELCGGTHLARTGQIGLLRIISEESVAAGVRRITAVTGRGAYATVKEQERVLGELSRELKAPPPELPARVRSMGERVKKLDKELAAAKRKALTGGGLDSVMAGAKDVEGVTLLAANMGEAGADDLRSAADVLRPKLAKKAGGKDGSKDGGVVLVLAGGSGGKASLACWVAPKKVAKKVKAGAIVKAIAPIVGGGGGGRDDMAQAGGRDPSKIDEALAAVEPFVRKALAGG